MRVSALLLAGFLVAGVSFACSDDSLPTQSPDMDAGLTAAGANTLAICHKTGNGRYKTLNVNPNAEKAHRGHGDGQVGDPVPGMDGMVFGETCAPEEVPQCIFEGSWSGTFNEFGVLIYPMEVDFLGCVEPGQQIADVSYPTLPCSGDWTLNHYTVDGANVHEFPLPGCVENTDYTLTYDENSGNIFGQADLIPGWTFVLSPD